MGEAELRVNQSYQTALDEGTPSPEQEGEKIRQGLDNSGNIEALPFSGQKLRRLIPDCCRIWDSFLPHISIAHR